MFQIEYSISNSFKKEKSFESNKIALRYDQFLGSIVFKLKIARIELDWGWIPLLDFAYSLVLICNSLLSKKSVNEIFEFTESDGKLFFERKGDLIKISTSFTDENLSLDINLFKKGVYSFYSKLVNEIKNENKKIIDNPSFKIFEDTLNDLSKSEKRVSKY